MDTRLDSLLVANGFDSTGSHEFLLRQYGDYFAYLLDNISRGILPGAILFEGNTQLRIPSEEPYTLVEMADMVIHRVDYPEPDKSLVMYSAGCNDTRVLIPFNQEDFFRVEFRDTENENIIRIGRHLNGTPAICDLINVGSPIYSVIDLARGKEGSFFYLPLNKTE